MKRSTSLNLNLLIGSAAALTAFSGCGSNKDVARSVSGSTAIKIVNDAVTSSSIEDSSASTSSFNGLTKASLSASGTVSASALSMAYLDSQLAPVSVNGLQLQASDINVNGQNIYVAYNAIDVNGVVTKVGAVEQVKPASCGTSLLGGSSFCLIPAATLPFPDADIFAAYSDGTNVYAVGSSTDVTLSPTYAGRLYKASLDSGGAPLAITATAVLNSYAGTGIVGVGTSVIATFGTSSTDSTKIGGLQSFTKSGLTAGTQQNIYDARSVVIDPVSSALAYVIAGPSGTASSSVMTYNSAVTAAATATTVVSGNTIAESKSSVVAGNSLILATTGSGGFKVICKATGVVMNTIPAPTFASANLTTARTVVNSIAAVPGFVFTANGEAGVNVYTIKKPYTTTLGIQSPTYSGTNYCQGVNLVYQGRMMLDADNSDATYINAELSANSIKVLTTLDVLGVAGNKLLVVASGNKGISLINVGSLLTLLNTIDVNDF